VGCKPSTSHKPLALAFLVVIPEGDLLLPLHPAFRDWSENYKRPHRLKNVEATHSIALAIPTIYLSHIQARNRMSSLKTT
jgi:hypothetical protein